MHTRTRQIQIELGVLCMKGEIALRMLESCINHGTGHAQPAVFPEDCAYGLTGFNTV